MRVERKDRLMTWTLDRPGQANGIDEKTLADMEGALDILEAQRSDIGCLQIVVDRNVFSTGLDGDLLEVCFRDRVKFAAVAGRLRSVLDRIEALPFVTIACVDGQCRLGGLELALACDLIVAGADARIRDGHLAYDAMPGAGGTNRLPARLGYSGALRFLLVGPTLGAREAVDCGLVDEVAPAGEARHRGAEIAAAVTQRDPSLVQDIKTSLRAASPIVTNQSYTKAFQRVVDRLVAE